MSENKTEVKARIVSAEDGSIKVVFFSAPTSPPLLGAKASGAKNAPVEDVTVAESGAEAPLDESILKKDLAAEEATAAETVDSDRAKAMFAAHKPRANAVFWSKFERPADPPPARTEDAPALEPVTAGGSPLPSIKEFPEEEPAAAGDADWNVSTKEFPVEEPVPEGIDAWKTPFPIRKIERNGESNLDDRSKKATKNLAPIGRVDPNGFAALLGTDDDEEDLAGVGSGNAFDDKEDVAGVGSDAPPPSTTPAGAPARAETEPTSTRSGLRFGRTFCSTSKLLCVFLTVAIGLGCSAFALSSYGSGGVSDLIESVFVPDAASIPVLDLSDTTPDVTADPASTPALMPHLDDRRLNDKDDADDAEDDDKDDDDAEDDDAKFSDLRGSDDDDASVSPPPPPLLPSVSPPTAPPLAPPTAPPLPQGFCACLEGRGCLQQGLTGQYTKCRTSNPPACDECNDPSITYGTGNVYSGPGYPYEDPETDDNEWCSQLGFTYSVSVTYGARTDLSGSIKGVVGCTTNADEASNVWRFCGPDISPWRAPGNTLHGYDTSATATGWITQVKCSTGP